MVPPRKARRPTPVAANEIRPSTTSDTEGRLLRTAAMIVALAALVAVTAGAPAHAQTQGPVNITNSAIADRAETRPNGTWADQCLVFVTNTIVEAGGPRWYFGFNTDTYQSQWSQRAAPVGSVAEARRGDIVQWGGGDGGRPDPHTAIVTAAGADPQIIDSNWSSTNDERVRRGTLSSRNYSGEGRYRIWRVGKVNVEALTDGTFVNDTSDGRVYVIAGGAPLYVSSWAAVGGPKPTIALSHAQLMSLPAHPRNGTLLGASGGGVFIVAGGAPIYLSSWQAIGGAKPVVHVDQWAVDHAGNPYSHLRAVPADGTLLGASGGGVFVVAGGAPIYVSNWDAIGGPQPSTRVDEWAVVNAGHPASHLRSHPADGTLLGASGGGVFVVAGGAPIYVSNWGAIGGPQPSTRVDEWAVVNAGHPASHLRSHPADGTHLRTSAERIYRIAGGAPIRSSSWSVFGGPQPSALIDQWAVDNASQPSAHLRPLPADGTVVKGLPSGAHWRFQNGRRASTTAAGAVAVDDIGLQAFPLAETSVGSVTTPSHQVEPSEPPNVTRTTRRSALTVRRTRGGVLLSWRRVAGARRYRVVVRAGRRVLRRTVTRPRLTVKTRQRRFSVRITALKKRGHGSSLVFRVNGTRARRVQG